MDLISNCGLRPTVCGRGPKRAKGLHEDLSSKPTVFNTFVLLYLSVSYKNIMIFQIFIFLLRFNSRCGRTLWGLVQE